MLYVECVIGRINGRNFPAIMTRDMYETILHGLGIDRDVTFESQEDFEAQGWEYDHHWEVEAEGLEEAIQKIAGKKAEADRAHECLEKMHRQHWAGHGRPIRIG
jgi:hypothetical protein